MLARYSMGIGDRFGLQGEAQLRAFLRAAQGGVAVVPVWNKSHREHTIIGSAPADVRQEAEQAVRALGWPGAYHVDADHVSLATVDRFVGPSDFFTLDVADFIGRPLRGAGDEALVRRFAAERRRYLGTLAIPGVPGTFPVDAGELERIARTFVPAVAEAGRIYRHLAAAKGAGAFITEISMDESEAPQTPVELFFILSAVADAGIPAQTIAPKFSGRFNKGVDYVGDVGRFAREFEDDLAVVAFAAAEFGLPPNLKLSVHSGSDKFSLYEPMHRALCASGAGLHLKTAGTTWLAELAGLALAGGEGLEIARAIYAQAVARADEFCAPYAAVINIRRERLPTPATVNRWSGEQFAAALRHDSGAAAYNPDFRQLLHVGYKAAAEMGARFTSALDAHRAVIGAVVTENLYERHLRPLFPPR